MNVPLKLQKTQLFRFAHIRTTSQADVDCEEEFVKGFSRQADGRYVSASIFERRWRITRQKLSRRLHNAVIYACRRMQQDAELASAYRKFIDEYLKLGHMRPLTPHELKDQRIFAHYIPHHAIWQRCDTGRKIRVVFNASRPTTSGRNLNGILHSGPKLQNGIVTVIVRWRTYRTAFCADVKMMFRQIVIRPDDVHLQRILWSPSLAEPITHYVLNTVTYGTTCAPYLSLRVLQQLCRDEGDRRPKAVRSVLEELYVDDVLTGADNPSSARELRDQLINLFKAGGCGLKKWVSNDPLLLSDLPVEDRLRPTFMQLSTEGPVHERGILRDPHRDLFKFIPPLSADKAPTKRIALAELARVFDSSGWLAPLTLIAKKII